MTATIASAAVPVIASDAEAVTAARALAAELAPGASDRDRAGVAPVEALDRLARSGLLGINVPRAHGGAGVSYVTLGEVFRILAEADPAVGQVPQNHFHFVTAIERDGTPDQQAFFFGEVLRGARFGNALQERTKGFRLGRVMETRLTPDPGGGFRLNGTKYYCTGAYTAQWIPVFALDPQDRLVLAYVGGHAEGVDVDDRDWFAMGQRSTVSGTSRFTDVHVPAEHVVEHWRTAEARSHFGAFAQHMHVAIDVGIADAAIADARAYVSERTRPWIEAGVDRAADDPHVLAEFGRLAIDRRSAHALLHAAGEALDAAEAAPGDEALATEASLAVAAAKVVAGELAVRAGSELFALAGTSATDTRLNLDRHWRNARTHTLHDPNRWKVHHLGNHLLNGTPPPLSGVI